MRRILATLGFSLYCSLFVLVNFCNTKAAVIILMVAFVITVILLSVFFITKRDKIKKAVLPVIAVISSILCSSLMFVIYEKTIYSKAKDNVGENLVLSGTINDFPKIQDEKHYYEINCSKIGENEVDFKVRLLVYADLGAKPCDEIRVTARHTYIISDNEGTLNNYKSKGIYLGAYANAEQAEIIPADNPDLLYYIKLFRKNIEDFFYKNVSRNEASVMTALLTGNRDNMPQKLYNKFLLCGVSHLIVVSGLHLSVWSYAVFAFLSKLRFNRYVKTLLSVLIILFLIALTGFSPSAVRAGIMLFIVYVGRLVSEDSDSLNSLGAALIVFCLSNPYCAGSISLTLSSVSTLGILVFAPYIDVFITKLTKKIKNTKIHISVYRLLQALGISLAATVSCLPFCAFYFGYTSVLAPICTFILAVPSEIAMIVSGISALALNVEILAKPLLFIAGIFAKFIVFVVDIFSKLPLSILSIDKPFFLILTVLILTGILILATLKKSRKPPLIAAVITISVMTVILISAYNIALYFTPRIILPAANNSSCIVIKDEKDLVVIGAGDKNIRYSLFEALQKSLDFNIDTLVVPRDKATESGGAEYIKENFNVGKIISHKDGILQYQNIKTENLTVEIETNEDFSGALITAKNRKILVIFYPASDINYAPQNFNDADILIARADIPFCFSESDFEEIYIMKEGLALQSIYLKG